MASYLLADELRAALLEFLADRDSEAHNDGRAIELRAAVEGLSALCESCGMAKTGPVTLAPDPWMHEYHGDDTPRWMCDDCRREACAEI